MTVTHTDARPGREPHEPEPWHALTAADVLRALAVEPLAGLPVTEVDLRRQRYGPNQLAVSPRRPPWRTFLDQFHNLLVGILVVGVVLAALVGDWKDAGVIAAVLLVNAVLGFVQEHRAERSLAALRRMTTTAAAVRRDGKITRIPATELVPGDLVLLEAGDRVPADGRVLVAAALEVDESSLTGESAPVAKSPHAVAAACPLGDRRGIVHMNSVVTRGRAEVTVTAIGMQTEIGRLAGMIAEIADAVTPLQRQLHLLGRRLAGVAAVAVATFVLLALLRGEPAEEVLMSAVALAVAAVPEGLPAVVTVTLALGVHRLARRGAIVKRLASVETLGATTVICSDKTGTLTQNRMTARRLLLGGRSFRVVGDGYEGNGDIEPEDGGPAPSPDDLVPLVLCNDSHVVDGELVGDPTEAALAALARCAGLDPDEERARRPRVAEVPFDPVRRMMATYHLEGGSPVVHVKGALDSLLPRCRAVSPSERDAWEAAAASMAADGLRVLAFASGPVAGDIDRVPDVLAEELAELDLVGIVGLLDPPRSEAREAVRRCHDAGIDVKMITGDHAGTASAIARAVGIVGPVRPGADLDDLDDLDVERMVAETAVFARVAPEHKVRIVRALQAQGAVVAMTGDGVNDAPALKAADIGIAMGITGTEVSKEAAAMVLTDDDFATIVRAVEGGRTIYDNIVKFVRFQLSTNVAAILSLVGAPLVGLPVPFSALQVLWVNLIMDGPPALALGVDPPSSGTMARPPRPSGERILHRRRLATVLLAGAVMAAGTLGMLAWQRAVGTEEHALAVAFTTFVLFQLFNVFNARSDTDSVFRRETFRNRGLLGSVAAVIVLQIGAVHLDPLQRLFGTADLTAGDWVAAVAVASSVLWVEELRKLSARRRARSA